MRTKYPRTMHFPFSPGTTHDDKVINGYDMLINQDVVITEKMDGENTTLYHDGLHARSLDSRSHPSRAWVKQFHQTFAYKMDPNDRICGENVFAKHSLEYDDLESYFYGFSAWEGDTCMSWDATTLYFEELGVTPVRELFRGIFDLKVILNLALSIDITKHEGFVVRVADSFDIKDFDKCVAKWVRRGHVTTNDHWMHADIVQNKLKVK